MGADIRVDKEDNGWGSSAGDLALSKVLRRSLPTYARAIAHVSAVIRLAERVKTVKEEEVVEVIHVDSRHHNPPVAWPLSMCMTAGDRTRSTGIYCWM